MTDASMRKINRNKPRNKPSNPLIRFNFDKILDPDPIIHVLQSLGPHRTVIINESLQRIGQVVLIRKIYMFTLEDRT